MDKQDIYELFDAGGLLAKRFAGYEFRDGQLAMALAVADAYNRNAVAVIEAGTGIGKSFAYLVPALFHAIEHPDERTVVATSTINLQRQLYDKDLAQLFLLLETACPVALAMGRGNYLCLYRLYERVNEAPLLARDMLGELGSLVAWSSETPSGLRADFPGPLHGEIWADVCCDADICLGYSCPYSHDCFFLRSRKQASEARIIIANHHLLFTDTNTRMTEDLDYHEDAVLPAFHRLIIDEAHNIEKNATDFFTTTYSGHEMLHTIAKISRKARQKQSLLETLALYAKDTQAIDSILESIARLGEAIGYVDTYLESWMRALGLANLLLEPNMQAQLVDLVPFAQNLITYATQMERQVLSFVEHASIPDELEFKKRELTIYTSRLRASAEVLRLCIDFENWTDDVHWIEMESHENHAKNAAIHITPLSIARPLKEALFSRMETVVCTSATLDLHDDFAYWTSRVGLPVQGREYITGVYPSPFDFTHNLLLLTPSDAPAFSHSNTQQFIEYSANCIRKAVLASGGGALVLFTSYEMLTQVYTLIASAIEKAGLTLLRQGDEDRFRLLRRFIEDRDSILFATDSFWEGVDAPGDTLRLVIIVKLPFRVPSDPVFQARQQALDDLGKSGFFHLALPEATMRLKQGFGRLLRTTIDSGIVLILDSRVVNKNYGQWMLGALPQTYHPDVLSSSIPGYIESFLYAQKE